MRDVDATTQDPSPMPPAGDGGTGSACDEGGGPHLEEEGISQVLAVPSLRRPSWASYFHGTGAEPEHPVVHELEAIQQRLLNGTSEGLEQPWVNTTPGNVFFGVLILLNSVFIGVDIELSDGREGQPELYMVIIESVFLVVFWVEIALRIRADGLRGFCSNRWGIFDFSCTFLGSLDAWVLSSLLGVGGAFSGVTALRALRLLRLLRLLRVFRTFEGLANLAAVLAGSLQAILWLALLLFIFIYMSSIFVYSMLEEHGAADEDIAKVTQDLLTTMFYHMMLLTGEEYTGVWVTPTRRLSGWWVVYWVACVIWLHIFMLNLIVGILVQQTLGSKRQEEEALANLAVESTHLYSTLMTLFSLNDLDADGTLSAKELNGLLDGKDLTRILRTFNIKTDVPRAFLLLVFDLMNKDHISFGEFYEACVRLCGSGRDIRSFMLQVDIARIKLDVSQRARDITRRLPQAAAVPAAAPATPPGAEPSAELRSLLRLARERMEALEEQQDALLEAVTSLRARPSAAASR